MAGNSIASPRLPQGEAKRKETLMTIRLRNGAFTLGILGSMVLLGTRSFAVEPDVDSPAGPELPAPRYDRPDFQYDDQTGAPRERDIEGTDSSVPDVVIVEPDVAPEVIPPPEEP